MSCHIKEGKGSPELKALVFKMCPAETRGRKRAALESYSRPPGSSRAIRKYWINILTILRKWWLAYSQSSTGWSKKTKNSGLWRKGVLVKTYVSPWTLSTARGVYVTERRQWIPTHYPLHSWCFSLCQGGTIVRSGAQNPLESKAGSVSEHVLLEVEPLTHTHKV